MKKLLIVGAGGHGRVIADIALKMNKWQQIAFLDDDTTVKSSMGYDVIGTSSKALNLIEEYSIFVAIGSNEIREMIYKQIKTAGATVPKLIHPSTNIGVQVEIGEGTVMMAGAIVNCGSKIGEGCIVNTGATIDHDATIGDYVHISPGVHISGTVKIGKGTWLGVGSVVSNNIRIAGGTVVGAGAVVVRDIIEAGTYIGVPAERIL
ncbi:MAG: sugar O-acyltransferase, sialic acid O-acetyltransferase NeuD family protein [Firmicutes bacterium]|nr:sugar O-acyltransferase, sialic acid O-acetyltransferase NeuD family protein [Bacillota bacterium]